MAGKITDLNSIGSVDASADYMEIVDATDGVNYKVNRNTLLGLSSTPVGTTDTQTLTNKTLTSPTISNPTLSGTLSGTYTIGGTPTFPSSVVTLTGTQTLTNKTLTSPTINTATISNPTLTVNSISEHTAANGVTVDGLTIKDGGLVGEVIDATNIDFGGSGSGIWWEEIGRTTLSSAGDTMTVSSIPARKYLRVLISSIDTGGTAGHAVTFNNDTGSNYAITVSVDFAAGTTATSQTSMSIATATSDTKFSIMEIVNIQAQEKLVIAHSNRRSTAGGANQPGTREVFGKWANTSAQITRIDVTNSGTGDYASGSEVIVLGHN